MLSPLQVAWQARSHFSRLQGRGRGAPAAVRWAQMASLAGLLGMGAAWAQIQGAAPPSDKATMERAQREADGPRRRILEAAKVRGVVRAAEPISVVVPEVPVAVASARPLAVMLPTLAPVVVPNGEQVAIANSTLAPVRLAPLAPVAVAQPSAATAVAVTQPRLLTKVDPEFSSRTLRRLARRTEMRVELRIEADGRVREVKVASGVGEELASAVREAMLQWRYEPEAAARLHVVDLVIEPS